MLKNGLAFFEYSLLEILIVFLLSVLGQRCCGTFQQKFGLIRDPSMGANWKIKFTNATLISRDTVAEIPRLTSSCLMALTSSSTASSAASSSPPSRESPSNNMGFS